RWLAVAAVVLAVSAVAPYLNHSYVNDAYGEWRSDLSRAYDDLDRAETFNPLSIDPVLAEGAIARADRDRARAIDAFHQAARDRPEEWAAHFNLAELYARRSPRRARSPHLLARMRAAVQDRPRGCSADSDHAVLERHGHGLGPSPRPELGLGVSDVGLHRRRGELEHLRDLLVGRPGSQHREHLPLAGGRPTSAKAAVDPTRSALLW